MKPQTTILGFIVLQLDNNACNQGTVALHCNSLNVTQIQYGLGNLQGRPGHEI